MASSPFSREDSREHHQVVMDRPGCLFITGGVLPPFAVEGNRFGELVSCGSLDLSLQALDTSSLPISRADSCSRSSVCCGS